ncbi:hypothetical protein F0562_035296 [Nyssa sinensis]|uniref:Uncharacterized protein n=1 Tax=Nyssa sinensis TaxID=561372 RepID=A0A5J5A9W1_9ASTE|nr:hypothetical protein F0562_035296 [Nyssa sinensis]
MNATGLLLLAYPPFPLIAPQQSRPWNPINPIPSLSSHLHHHHHIIYTRYRRWDSNAETFRNQNFNFTSQYNNDDGDDDDEDNSFRRKRKRWWSEDLPPDLDSGVGVLEEFIDSVWIFRVFRSFGWMLPFIIAPILLATGPKAFLMALAVPIGQSAFSLAIEKLLGRKQKNAKRKAKTKKKPRARSAGNVELEQEEEERQGTKKRKMGYQSWVAGNDISADNSNQDEPGFRGWDELDRRREFDNGSGSMSARAAGKSQRTPSEKGKLNKRVGKGEMPLLLRLLIAVFPFLGSWTKML